MERRKRQRVSSNTMTHGLDEALVSAPESSSHSTDENASIAQSLLQPTVAKDTAAPSTTTSTSTAATPSPQAPDPAPDSLINHSASLAYWASVPPTLSGILGGYPPISRIDLQGSRNFLAKLRRHYPGTRRLAASHVGSGDDVDVGNGHSDRHNQKRNHKHENSNQQATKPFELGVDCGAGIGRVTDGLLMDVCEKIDIVEPIAQFAAFFSPPSPPQPSELETAAQNGVDELSSTDISSKFSAAAQQGQIGEIYLTGLESWDPQQSRLSPTSSLSSPSPSRRHEENNNDDGDGDGGTTVQQQPRAKTKKKYDLIWNQWCLGHLTDSQLLAHLIHCGQLLRQSSPLPPHPLIANPSDDDDIKTTTTTTTTNPATATAQANTGQESWLIVKENISTVPDTDIYDPTDSAVTRTDAKFRSLFAAAGLKLVRDQVQHGFPRELGLYPVVMYALRPESWG